MIILWLGFVFSLYLSANATHCHSTEIAPRKQKLSLGVLLPETHRKLLEPYIKLALYHVHTTPSILPNYCIDLLFKDTQVPFIRCHCFMSFEMYEMF